MTQREAGVSWELVAAAALASASFGPVAMSGSAELGDPVQFVPPDTLLAYIRDDEVQMLQDTMWLPLGPEPFDGTSNGGRGFIPHQYRHRAARHR